jgi:hypothetical protein
VIEVSLNLTLHNGEDGPQIPLWQTLTYEIQPMNVKQLIEILQKFPEDLEVVGQWRDGEYGADITQSISVYEGTVKNTNGIYGLGSVFQYGKELPSTDVEVLIIDV